jgi:hypothetical protein
VGFDTLSDKRVKFVRITLSRIENSKWLLIMNYLIKDNGNVKHFKEVHKLLALNCQDYIRALRMTGFKEAKFLNKEFWKGNRGLFIATK